MKHSQRMVEFEWIVFVRISWGVWRMLLFVCFSFILANSYVCGDCCIAFFFCAALVGRSILPFLLLLYLWQEIPRIYFVTCKYCIAHNGIVSRMDTYKKCYTYYNIRWIHGCESLHKIQLHSFFVRYKH